MDAINQTKHFMESYKKLEVLLRESNQTILNYEDTLSQIEKDKLRICRQIRNYIFHHDDGEEFLLCSKSMCTFLQELITRESDDSHSRRVLTLNPVHVDDRLSDIKIIFGKNNREWMPVVDSSGNCLGSIGLFQSMLLSAKQSPNKKLSSVVDLSFFKEGNIPLLNENGSEIDDFEGNDAIVIGENFKYIGVLK